MPRVVWKGAVIADGDVGSSHNARLVYLRLSDEGERRLARVFRNHERERE